MSGPDPEGRLVGSWVTLEPLAERHAAELKELDERRRRQPAMGGGTHMALGGRRFAPPMLVRENRSGGAVGVMESGEMTGYPGVAVLVVFVDPELGRPGYGLEAYALYVSELFRGGAAKVHVEVYEFNRDVLGLMRKTRLEPEARLRDHAYVAGRWWDMLVFGFDAPRWDRIMAPYERLLPGRERRPAALGRPADKKPGR